jgi:hypothetical protein
MSAEPQNYIIKFKKGVSDADVEKFYKEVAQQGGQVSSKDHQSKRELWQLLFYIAS